MEYLWLIEVSIDNPSGQKSLSFSIDEDGEPDVSLIAFTSTQVNLTYSATVNGTGKKSESGRFDPFDYTILLVAVITLIFT